MKAELVSRRLPLRLACPNSRNMPPLLSRMMPILLIALVCMSASAQSGSRGARGREGSGQSVEQPASPSAPQASCPLTIAEAPELATFKLGMGLTEVLARLPGVKVSPADELGVSNVYVEFPPEKYSSTGISNLSFEFTDARLSYIRVGYPITTKLNSVDAFLAAVATSLNLSGTWDNFYDRDDKTFRDIEDFRDKSLECRDFRISVGIGVEGFGEQTPHIKLEDMTAQRKVKAREDEEQRRKAEEEQRRPSKP